MSKNLVISMSPRDKRTCYK